jgi:hypothetical protein
MGRRRWYLVPLVAVLVAAGGVIGGWALLSSSGPGPECTVPRPAGAAVDVTAVDVTEGTTSSAAPTGPLTLDAVQLQHASTINAVGLARGLPERARVIALATAWQESSLRNIDHGDRDSVGLFQQRTSQGWGDVAQLMDPVYAAGAFYDALLNVSGWQRMSLAEAAQRVQRSAYPDAYAKWEDDARALAVQLGGTVPVTLTCRSGATASTAPAPTRPDVPGASTADPDLANLLAAAQAELTGLAVVSVGPDGRSATVTATLPDAPAADAGRALAGWAVAHGTTMAVTEVSVLGRVWSGHAWSDAGQQRPAGQVTITVGR